MKSAAYPAILLSAGFEVSTPACVATRLDPNGECNGRAEPSTVEGWKSVSGSDTQVYMGPRGLFGNGAQKACEVTGRACEIGRSHLGLLILFLLIRPLVRFDAPLELENC
jgi:hypothetical protein